MQEKRKNLLGGGKKSALRIPIDDRMWVITTPKNNSYQRKYISGN